ncbi:MAG TPA: peptidoglycan editing factor PgeF [Paenalcaligenes sp.]|nr:peptidoglycan editing factor PgeF [Paenalcaligenes sp.]
MNSTNLSTHTFAPFVQGSQGERLRYFTTTRQSGMSTGPWASWNLGAHCGDDAQAVSRNRMRLQEYLPAPPHWLQQVHGTEVVQFRKNTSDPAVLLTADAAFTRDTDCVLAILTADCLPIVVTDADNSILGVAHAGWRGLAAGVIAQLARQLQRYCQSEHWFAWVGPAIGAQHFEVGQEVYDAFVQDAPQDRQHFVLQPDSTADEKKWHADLAGLAQMRLERSFAARIQVEQSQLCTFTQAEQFYSYRRDGITGRMATVAWLSSTT